MIPAATLYAPASFAEALDILAGVEGPRYLLAGGTDLLVKAKAGVLPAGAWIDLSHVAGELRFIREARGRVEVGAMATFSDLERSDLIARTAPALQEAARISGSVAIRNMATIGGNFGNASPAGDTIPAVITLGGAVHLRSARGTRAVPAEEFFTGPGKTVRGLDEAVERISFPIWRGVRGAFLRLGQRLAQAISKVSVAVSLTLQAGTVEEIRIAFGAVAPTVIRARAAETILRGAPLDDDRIARAAEAARAEVRPITDIRSTAAYRREQSGVLLSRALGRLREP